MKPANLASASCLVALLAWPIGCLQLTGVADYKVEEGSTPAACTPPPGSACRVAPNCGCADNETCELQDVSGNGACKPAGSVARGGVCTAPSECGKGMLCIDSRCEPYCSTSADCDTKQCSGITLGGTAVKDVGYCSTPCDPSVPTCSDGGACKFATKTQTLCVPAGSKGDNEACTNDGECGAGLVCGDGNKCTPLCAAGSTCSSGATCLDVGLTYNGTSYGYCPRG